MAKRNRLKVFVFFVYIKLQYYMYHMNIMLIFKVFLQFRHELKTNIRKLCWIEVFDFKYSKQLGINSKMRFTRRTMNDTTSTRFCTSSVRRSTDYEQINFEHKLFKFLHDISWNDFFCWKLDKFWEINEKIDTYSENFEIKTIFEFVAL